MNAPSRAGRGMGVALAIGAVSATATGAGAQTTTRDSAGIAIVTTARGTPIPTAFTVPAKPFFDVGGPTWDAREEFETRVTSAIRLSDGRVVVSGGRATRVTLFDAQGKVVTELLRRPEVRGLQSIAQADAYHVANDTVAIMSMGRLSYYSPDHGLVGTEPEMQISPLVFLGSELLAATWSGDSVWVVRIQRGTTAARPLARRVAGFVNPGIPRGRTIRRNARGDSYIAAAVPVFMPRLELAADQDRLFAGNSLSWEIREFTISGQLARIIRLDPDLKITTADIERYRERQLAPYEPAARRVIEQRMRPSDFPETFPAFERLLIDGAGRLWVEDLERTGFKDSGQWMVFDREGWPLGRVALPAGFHVSQIGSDYVLGWWMAPDQFARIRMYELIPAETQRPASPGERERRIR